MLSRSSPVPASLYPVLRVAVSVVAAALLAGCPSTPDEHGKPAATAPASAAPAPATAAAAVSAEAPAAPASAAPAIPEREIAGAAHVLVSYKGAELAPAGTTRTKEAAKQRAEEALGKLKKDNTPFEELVKKYSDDPMSKTTGGSIGNFERNAVPKEFATSVFGMKVGEMSDVVETPRGFHIIRRTK